MTCKTVCAVLVQLSLSITIPLGSVPFFTAILRFRAYGDSQQRGCCCSESAFRCSEEDAASLYFAYMEAMSCAGSLRPADPRVPSVLERGLSLQLEHLQWLALCFF